MKLLVLLSAELRRSWALVRSYWLEYVSDFALYALGFLLLLVVFHAATDDYGPEGYLSTLIGFITWKICASTLAGIADIVALESRTGTLEQLFVTGLRPGLTFLGRSIGIFVNHGTRGLLLGVILAGLTGVLRPVPPLAVGVFALTVVGACGFGFALAGLVLVYNRLEELINLIWQMLVFFTGALAPLNHPLFSVVASVLPLSWGIRSLRAILVEGAGVRSLWEGGYMLGLLISTVVYVMLGAVLFGWGQRRARSLGTLGHY